MTRAQTWAVQHLEVDGEAVDRDDGYPTLTLELHPIGIATQHPVHQLHVKVGRTATVIGEDGIAAIRKWLEKEVLS